MKPVPFEQACALLDVSRPTLRRWLQMGAPQARKGRRGRGGQALLDVDAIAAWKRQQDARDALVVLAAELPELVANVVYKAFCMVDGINKRPSADVMAATWYMVTDRLLDRIGEQVPVRGIDVMPEPIEKLRQIAKGDFTEPRRGWFEWSEYPRLYLNTVVSNETLTASMSCSK